MTCDQYDMILSTHSFYIHSYIGRVLIIVYHGYLVPKKIELLDKKFRNRGNKDGALASFRKLESDGLGTLLGENLVWRFHIHM